MSVQVSGGVIRIVGSGRIEDAEPILAALNEEPSRVVDLGQAAHLHTAVVQILFAFRPSVCGMPSDPFYAAHVAPLLDRGREHR